MNLNEGNNKAITSGTETRKEVKERMPKTFTNILYPIIFIIGVIWIISELNHWLNEKKPLETGHDEVTVIPEVTSVTPETTSIAEGKWTESITSFFEIITTSPPWQALYELLGAGVAATLILWALLILIVLWVVKTILVILRNFSLEKKNKKEVFTIGITGKLAITLLVFGFFFSVFIAFTDGGKFNTRTFVNVRLDQLSVGGTEVKTMDFATTAKVMLPRTRVTDGVTINVACAEIIEPSHILYVEGIPKIHITSVTTSPGNTRDFEIPKEMREFLGSMGVSKVKVKFTLVQSTIHRTSAEDCPHS